MREIERLRKIRRLAWVFVAVVVALLLVALVWSASPMREWLEVDAAVRSLRAAAHDFGILPAVLGFSAACVLAVPLTFLVVASVLAFGPLVGALCALAGAAIGSAVSFWLGRRLGAEALRHFAGPRVNDISERLGRRGILAAVALRMVPVAPFAVINMIAGTSHIAFRDFLIGSTLGMLPMVIVTASFLDGVLNAVREPGAARLVALAVFAALIVGGGLAARRWVGR